MAIIFDTSLVDWKQLLSEYSCEDVIKFLTEKKIYKAIKQFQEIGVDGQLLLEALENEEMFKEFTSAQFIRAKIRNGIEDYVLAHAN